MSSCQSISHYGCQFNSPVIGPSIGHSFSVSIQSLLCPVDQSYWSIHLLTHFSSSQSFLVSFCYVTSQLCWLLPQLLPSLTEHIAEWATKDVVFEFNKKFNISLDTEDRNGGVLSYFCLRPEHHIVQCRWGVSCHGQGVILYLQVQGWGQWLGVYFWLHLQWCQLNQPELLCHKESGDDEDL